MSKDEILDPLLKNYTDLLSRVDVHIQQVAARYSDQIACHRGCDSCCRFLTLFPVEAFALSRAFECLDKSAQKKVEKRLQLIEKSGDKEPENCPLLVDRICLIYPARPVICRTHGLPLYIKKDGKALVDFCPENFKNMTSFPKDALINLDQLNTLLTAVNKHFTASVDADLPDRIPVSQALFLCRDMIED
ncbi:MAG: YkgJ family cysteine cluster protein [Desulfobacter sp.]|nr:MAG: YkgJ family cysteine cluster protein [Desulfobacter sp.]